MIDNTKQIKMRSLFKFIFSVIFVTLTLFTFGQNKFVELGNANGLDFTQSNVDSFENVIQDSLIILPSQYQQDFKIFDLGLYINNSKMYANLDDFTDSIYNDIKASEDYFILIIRHSSQIELNYKFEIKYNLPLDQFACLEGVGLSNVLENYSNYMLKENSYLGNLERTFIVELNIIKYFFNFVNKGICCSAEMDNFEGIIAGKRYENLTSCNYNHQKVLDAYNALSLDPVYIELMNLIDSLYQFINNCIEEEWMPGDPRGIIPKCTWVNSDPILKYTITDLPFVSGMVDGSYAYVIEALELLELVKNLNDWIYEFAHDITMYYTACAGHFLTSSERIRLLMMVAVNHLPTGFGTKMIAHGSTSLVQEINELRNDFCTAKEKNINKKLGTFYTICAVLLDKDTYVQLWESVMNTLEEVYGQINGLDNENRYYAGFYVYKTALEFAPVGSIAKLNKFTSIKNKLKTEITNISDELKSPGPKRDKFIRQNNYKLKANALRVIKDDLTLKERLAFKKDFVDNDNISFKDVDKILDEDLLGAWKHCNKNHVNTNWRKDYSYLKEYKYLLNQFDNIRKHLLGEVIEGKAIGGHLQEAFDGTRVIVIKQGGYPTFWDPPNNLQVKQTYLKILKNNNYLKKDKKSTVFPKDWNNQKVIEEMSYVMSDQSNKVTDFIWVGNSSTGLEIKINLTLKDGKKVFSTVRPNID